MVTSREVGREQVAVEMKEKKRWAVTYVEGLICLLVHLNIHSYIFQLIIFEEVKYFVGRRQWRVAWAVGNAPTISAVRILLLMISGVIYGTIVLSRIMSLSRNERTTPILLLCQLLNRAKKIRACFQFYCINKVVISLVKENIIN